MTRHSSDTSCSTCSSTDSDHSERRRKALKTQSRRRKKYRAKNSAAFSIGKGGKRKEGSDDSDESDSDSSGSGGDEEKGLVKNGAAATDDPQHKKGIPMWFGILIVVLIVALCVGGILIFQNRSTQAITVSPAAATGSATSVPSQAVLADVSSSGIDLAGTSTTLASGAVSGAAAVSSVSGVAGSKTSTKSRPSTPKASATSPNTSAASSTSIGGVVSIASKPATSATAWIPVEKVRGVNLGSLFVIEPWMAPTAWKKIGCTDYKAEANCVAGLGLDKVQAGFENHWDTWLNQTDFTTMAAFGLNTVRIPLGYWSVDALNQDGKYAKGSWKYVKQIASWAKAAGLYVILDLHAAPGVSTPDQAFAGEWLDTPGFYGNTTNFQIAWKALANWTTEVHTHAEFSTTVAIQVLNEPVQTHLGKTPGLLDTYYPGAYDAIRNAEAALGVKCEDTNFKCLGIQYMDKNWNSGDPLSSLNSSVQHVLFDDHDYVKWITPDQSQDGYMKYSCKDTRVTGNSPTIVGEFSLTSDIKTTPPASFFNKWAKAQLLAAEKGAGWMFWSWKQEQGNSQWGFQDAVYAGWFDVPLTAPDASVCSGYT